MLQIIIKRMPIAALDAQLDNSLVRRALLDTLLSFERKVCACRSTTSCRLHCIYQENICERFGSPALSGRSGHVHYMVEMPRVLSTYLLLHSFSLAITLHCMAILALDTSLSV